MWFKDQFAWFFYVGFNYNSKALFTKIKSHQHNLDLKYVFLKQLLYIECTSMKNKKINKYNYANKKIS